MALGIAALFHLWPKRGNFQKFDREIAPTLLREAQRINEPVYSAWFGDVVGMLPSGHRHNIGQYKDLFEAEQLIREAATKTENGTLVVLWNGVFRVFVAAPHIVLGDETAVPDDTGTGTTTGDTGTGGTGTGDTGGGDTGGGDTGGDPGVIDPIKGVTRTGPGGSGRGGSGGDSGGGGGVVPPPPPAEGNNYWWLLLLLALAAASTNERRRS